MRNLKKIIAVVVTLVMLLSVATVAASASDTLKLSLVGRSQTAATNEQGYYELSVVLTDDNSVVGGIEGIIDYDESVYTYASAELTDAFVADGNPDVASVLVNDAEKGTIKFVGLGGGTGTWFTLKFTVADVQKTTTFALETKGANALGTDYLTVAAEGKNASVEPDILKLSGATIKKTDDLNAQDIKFLVTVNTGLFAEKYTGYEVESYGLMMMFTKRLNGRELTVDMIDNEEYGLAVAEDYSGKFETFTANLNRMTADAVAVKISARAYARLSDGTNEVVIYSNNYDSGVDTKCGYESKSVVNVAKSAAKEDMANCSDEDELTAINAIINKTEILTPEEKATLFAFVKKYCD